MRLTRLDVQRLRRLEPVSIAPGPTLNWITGDNGAGKTSLLEAIHLLAYGRSFRGPVRDGLIRTGAESLEVFAEWQEASRQRRVGLRHTGQTWEGRLDGASAAALGELCAALAVVTFEPGSHALVSGGGEPRRRWLDWGLFHVEQDFLPLWRRYARALKQRNALLKGRPKPDQLDVWERELAEAGEPLTSRRQAYLDRLQPQLTAVASDLVPSLGQAGLDFQPGWRRQELSLADALLVARERDLATGYTSVGPHRADWRIEYAARPGREALSRGQAKLTALACLLAQAEDYAAERGEWPVVALDDLASELDRAHQHQLLARLQASGAQVFITGTDKPEEIRDAEWFHVEHGRVIRGI
ncbi:DNA replication/repair protein RecF [Luteimonas gilva]|uniref:DNA replication and repair protein RecF n=1 Tax=Luteimonas gilva TaxID=2572684 RepID=A0A4U5JLT7_9GAMM|nr:DNA replication/repair protein RecF [Luteimonas gilva]TKR30135.1 DNA replication/repair protein RecF [Luteimonas gilva]